MDDSSQNSPGIPQQTAPKNTGSSQSAYPEYPTPNPVAPQQKPPPKRRKPVLFIIAGSVALLLILALVVVFAQSGHNSKPVACANEKCFTGHFSQCSPAAYTYNDAAGSVQYTILGNAVVGCSTTVNYIKSDYFAAVAGKTMTCDFDNRKNFQLAAQNVFHFPEDYNCKGNLVSFYQDSSGTSSEP